MAGTAILDVDGTLVDTNYHHALAWYRAFRAQGLVLALWRIHRSIGMEREAGAAAVVEDLCELLAESRFALVPDG